MEQMLEVFDSRSLISFLKLMTMIEHIKMMQIPYLDIWSMLLFGQVPHTNNSSHLFWNAKDSELVQALSYWRKIIYHQLLIGFFYKLISIQDIGYMLHLNVA